MNKDEFKYRPSLLPLPKTQTNENQEFFSSDKITFNLLIFALHVMKGFQVSFSVKNKSLEE